MGRLVHPSADRPVIARIIGTLAGLLLAVGGWQVGEAVWIHAKAGLAQVLIKRAWAETQNGAAHIQPWAWADTWPVARIAVPRLDVDQIVLAGASGRTLAFGPGHMGGTAAPGGDGVSVINGHRDTHFKFLQDLEPGDAMAVTDRSGARRTFRITETQIVDSEKGSLAVAEDASLMALVTCYPFDAVDTGGPLRYVVLAEPEATPGAPIPVPSPNRARRL